MKVLLVMQWGSAMAITQAFASLDVNGVFHYRSKRCHDGQSESDRDTMWLRLWSGFVMPKFDATKDSNTVGYVA